MKEEYTKLLDDYKSEHVIKEYFFLKLGKFFTGFEFVIESITSLVARLIIINLTLLNLLILGKYIKIENNEWINEYKELENKNLSSVYLKKEHKYINTSEYIKFIFKGIFINIFLLALIIYIGIPIGILRIIYVSIGKYIIQYTFKLLALCIAIIIVLNIIKGTNGFDLETIQNIFENNILSNEFVKKYINFFPDMSKYI